CAAAGAFSATICCKSSCDQAFLWRICDRQRRSCGIRCDLRGCSQLHSQGHLQMNKAIGIVSAAAFLATASSALAADIVYEEPAPYTPPAAVAYDWTGVYIGVQGGYVWTDLDFPGGGNENFNGGTLGAHVGANWQHDSVVFGVEADINYIWNENDYLLGGVPVEIGTDWAGSIRARLGFALDRTLIYGTGGLAIAR